MNTAQGRVETSLNANVGFLFTASEQINVHFVNRPYSYSLDSGGGGCSLLEQLHLFPCISIFVLLSFAFICMWWSKTRFCAPVPSEVSEGSLHLYCLLLCFHIRHKNVFLWLLWGFGLKTALLTSGQSDDIWPELNKFLSAVKLEYFLKLVPRCVSH